MELNIRIVVAIAKLLGLVIAIMTIMLFLLQMAEVNESMLLFRGKSIQHMINFEKMPALQQEITGSGIKDYAKGGAGAQVDFSKFKEYMEKPEGLEADMKKFPGTIQLAFKDISNNNRTVVKNNKTTLSDSTTKLFVAGAHFHFNKDNLDWKNLELMLRDSDNCASNIIIDQLPEKHKSVTDYARKFNKDTAVYNYYAASQCNLTNPDPSKKNLTNSKDLAEFMFIIDKSTSEPFKKSIEFMKKSTSNEKIYGKLYHKTGELPVVDGSAYEHDVAVVQTKNGKYVLAIMTTGKANGEMITGIKSISKKIYDLYNSAEAKQTPQSYTGPQDGSLAAKAIAIAESKLGIPYLLGGVGPNVYDCSALVSIAYHEAGVKTSQRRLTTWGMERDPNARTIPCDQAKAGDFMLSNNVNHVVMLLSTPVRGDEHYWKAKYIHASSYAGAVSYSSPKFKLNTSAPVEKDIYLSFANTICRTYF